MKRTLPEHGAAFGVLLAAALAMSGCSLITGSSDLSSPTAPGPRVDVTETEFSITLSPPTLTPGTYLFAVTNEGGTQHNLFVNGPGVDNLETPTLAPAQTVYLTVTLKSGRYELWSNVGNDRPGGMDLWITVP